MGVNGIYGLSGSGLDIESMVKVGMMGKQNEYDRMQQKFTTNEWTKAKYIETYGTIQTFNNSTLSQYKMSGNMNARLASSSNATALSATANATAANMTHYVEVTGLASAAYLIGAHGDNGVKTHNVGDTSSIKLADALFGNVAQGSEATTQGANNRLTTYNKIVADGVEHEPSDIAFQFAVGDGLSGISSSNNSVVTVGAAIGTEKGTHTVTVQAESASVSLNSVDLAGITHYDNIGIASDGNADGADFDEQIKNIAFKYKNTSDDESTITFGNLNYLTDRDDFATLMIEQYPDELRSLGLDPDRLDEDTIRARLEYEDVSDTINARSTYTTLANDEDTLRNTTALSFTISDGTNSAEITFNYLEIMQGTATLSELNKRISMAGLNIESEYEVGGELTLSNPQPGSENKISITVAADEENNPVGTNTAAFLNAIGLTNSVTNQQYGSAGAPAYAAGETLEAAGADVTMTVDGVNVPLDENGTATVDGVTYTAVGSGEATVNIDYNVISVTYQQLMDGYTFNDLAAAVNGLGTNVRATYDSVQDSFSFYNTESGSKNGVTLTMASNTDDDAIGDRTAQFFTNLGLQHSSRGNLTDEFDSTFRAGETKTLLGDNASVKIDGVSYDLDSNKATVGGVIYNFNQITTEPVTVTITQDTDKIVGYVKSFVEDYNKLLASLQDLYSEKPNSGYTPLTDAQRNEMKEEQITKWEEKAKEGLLYHDSTLGHIIDKMRDAISQKIEGVDGKYTSVYAIGISTTGIKGQLTLDEDKLRAALADDPNSVYNVFAKLDSNDATSGNGIAVRLGEVFTNGLKSIKTRAGTSSDISEDSDLNNLLRELQTKMSNFKIMMNAFEDKLYKKYDAMESSLALLGAQLNYVTSAFSG